MSAGADELRLASEHDRREERARELFDAAALAWWNERGREKSGREFVGELYQDHLDHDRTRAQLADALGRLQRLHLVTAELIAAQNAVDVFDRQKT